MAFTDRRLETPTPDLLVRGSGLLVRGSFKADEPALVVTASLDGVERGRVAPERRGGRWRYCLFLDVTGTSCRLDLEVKVERLFGAPVRLHRVPAWRPVHRPTPRRDAVVAVEARWAAGRVAGALTAEAPVARVEGWRRGRRVSSDVAADGSFAFDAPEGPVHLWACFEGAGRPDLHLGRLPARREGDPAAGPLAVSRAPLSGRWVEGYLNGRPAESVVDKAGALTPEAGAGRAETLEFETVAGALFMGRRAAFTPMRTYEAAAAEGRLFALSHTDGRREEADIRRLVATADGWSFVLRDDDGAFRLAPVAGLAAISPSETAAEPSSGPPAPELRAFVDALPKPAGPIAQDEPPFGAAALPSLDPRAPPPDIARVVLLRHDEHPTDALYVRAPLGPLLAGRGVPLDIVTMADRSGAADALSRLKLDAATVVIVSRGASAGWIDRLAAEAAPFVIYLMDDDALAVAESNGLPPRYRRRMLEAADAEFRPLVARADRFLVTSPGLAARYRSAKTATIEPPFIRPAPSLKHLDELSRPTIAYHGTCVHHDDIGFLFGEIERLLVERPALRFQLITDQTLPKSLTKLPNFEPHAPMAWRDYTAFAAENPAHLFLAPMLETPFNAGKSIIKLHDAASLGATPVCSDVSPFRDAATPGEDAILVENDPAAWGCAIRALLDDPARLKRIALARQDRARRDGALSRAQAVWRGILGIR